MRKINYIFAGTGHRPNKLFIGITNAYEKKVHNKLIDLAEWSLTQYKPFKVISGMAQGWDLALAHASLNLKIPLICAIPFKGQETKWGSEWESYYNKIVRSADRKVMVSRGGYEKAKYQKRNEWMVDNCDTVLALYDGSPGGTRNCVEYAERQSKQIINLWDVWKTEFSRETISTQG